jgi:hypothetical protein
MVIVNDTESFIAKSRQIHGDKYDYSKTTYVAAKKPITITCKKCGKEFELSQAGSHIRKRKPSGCRKCRRRKCKTCQCGFRGYGDRLFPRQGGGMCISCWGLAKEEKERRRKELLNRKCRNCGKKLNTTDKRQITCGNECGYAVRIKPRKEVSCCVCGKALIRRAASQHKSHCCSLECQRKHALIYNHSAKHALPRKTNGKIQKRKYRKQESLRRKSNSLENQWWIKCSLSNAYRTDKSGQTRWEKKCISTSSSMRQQLFYSKKNKKKPSKTFENLCKTLFRKTGEKDAWKTKCYSVEKNMIRRRRLRNVRKNICQHTEPGKQHQRQLQLWA